MNAITMPHATRFAPDPTNTRQLRSAMGKFATGVTVVTCMSPDGPACISANSFSSISLDPAIVMWAIATGARRYPLFEHAEHYAIHVLSDAQTDLCSAASKDVHALKDIAHGSNMEGVPLIDDCLARFECKRTACHEAGDHVIVLGEVLQAEMREGNPLTFYAGEFGTFAR